jgi:hypothetical protein
VLKGVVPGSRLFQTTLLQTGQKIVASRFLWLIHRPGQNRINVKLTTAELGLGITEEPESVLRPYVTG